MIEFYQPTSTGEWLAFASAILTLIWGLTALARSLTLRTTRGGGHGDQAMLAGFLAAGGIVAIMMAQPLLYLGLGAGWALACLFGALVKVRHGIAGAPGWPALAGAAVLAVPPLAYVFGYL